MKCARNIFQGWVARQDRVWKNKDETERCREVNHEKDEKEILREMSRARRVGDMWRPPWAGTREASGCEVGMKQWKI